MSKGLLVLAGTPIGDVRDASPRLISALTSADVIAAEDTRKFMALLARLGIETSAQIISYFDGNEIERTPKLLNELLDGKTVVLVTDAGMPSISDPGYRIVSAAIEEGIRVTAVPGPSAVLTALAVSGLPVQRFCFEGFAPRKAGQRRKFLAELASEARTMVFFEAPHRLADFLTDCVEVFGAERLGAVCRELTKTYEEIIRGRLDELIEWAQGGVRGECTIVIEGCQKQPVSLPEAVALVGQRVSNGEKLSSAVTEVAAATGVKRKELYDLALKNRDLGPQDTGPRKQGKL